MKQPREAQARRGASRRAFIAGVAAAVLPHESGAAGSLPVVATFSILGDFVREAAGDRATLNVLVGPGGDAHVYSPSPADGRRVSEARLVVTNGFKFEGWITRLIQASATRAKIIEAAKGVETILVDENSPAHDHGDHSHAGETDPHAWQSAMNAKVYVANIRHALAEIDPASAPYYRARAEAYNSIVSQYSIVVTI